MIVKNLVILAFSGILIAGENNPVVQVSNQEETSKSSSYFERSNSEDMSTEYSTTSSIKSELSSSILEMGSSDRYDYFLEHDPSRIKNISSSPIVPDIKLTQEILENDYPEIYTISKNIYESNFNDIDEMCYLKQIIINIKYTGDQIGSNISQIFRELCIPYSTNKVYYESAPGIFARAIVTFANDLTGYCNSLLAAIKKRANPNFIIKINTKNLISFINIIKVDKTPVKNANDAIQEILKIANLSVEFAESIRTRIGKNIEEFKRKQPKALDFQLEKYDDSVSKRLVNLKNKIGKLNTLLLED